MSIRPVEGKKISMGAGDRDAGVTLIMCRATQITSKYSKPTHENSFCVLGNTKHLLDTGTIFEAYPSPGWEDGFGDDALVIRGGWVMEGQSHWTKTAACQ